MLVVPDKHQKIIAMASASANAIFQHDHGDCHHKLADIALIREATLAIANPQRFKPELIRVPLENVRLAEYYAKSCTTHEPIEKHGETTLEVIACIAKRLRRFLIQQGTALCEKGVAAA